MVAGRLHGASLKPLTFVPSAPTIFWLANCSPQETSSPCTAILAFSRAPGKVNSKGHLQGMGMLAPTAPLLLSARRYHGAEVGTQALIPQDSITYNVLLGRAF